ncbi:MAG: DEAD/DEAH box helicase [bacterium]|nr:DEAD/DEAH box helicase [bacterium]
MTTSSTSVSEPTGSSAFTRLHPRIQRWVYDQGWTTLHDAQERATAPILDGDSDVIIAAATAAGKTEAAFLPILSSLANGDEQNGAERPGVRAAHEARVDPVPIRRASVGVQVLYISPLKALINDQYQRLQDLCERVDVPVHRWHGDVSTAAKRKVTDEPSGVLLITPESLEATFVNRGPIVSRLLSGLRYVVIDELHSFLTTQRGAQLQSLMHRIELAIRRRPPRIGMSATLGDTSAAAAFLRPNNPEQVAIVESESDGRGLMLQMRGYIAPEKATTPPAGALAAGAAKAEDAAVEQGPATANREIADHLYERLRGQDNLVFANSRNAVEAYADLLSRRSAGERVPNEFRPHHGNLSKDLREATEEQLKDPARPATAVSTSTLELGIDIGTVASVAQLGPPPSVSSLWQRLGRSGRRDDPAVLRLYITEQSLHARSVPADALRCGVVQTTAMVRLMLDRWLESPDDPGFNYSTLVQQIMSAIAQHGGATASDLYGALCGPGPFRLVDQERFVRLLRAMAGHDLLTQNSEGLLLHGQAGEHQVNNYRFYTAFHTADEWRIVTAGKTLGTIPIYQPLRSGALLIFAGKRWKVVDADRRGRIVQVEMAEGGVPHFSGGSGPTVSDRVRAEMSATYRSPEMPSWLDRNAQGLLSEGRAAFRRYGLAETTVVPGESEVRLFPWTGDRALSTAAMALSAKGLAANVEGPAIRIDRADAGEVAATVAQLLAGPRPEPAELAAAIKNPEIDKWDWVLDEPLACESAGARLLDVEGAWKMLWRVVSDLRRA